MEVASKVLILTVGGACGVNARYWLGLAVARWFGARFPWATFAVNVSGSFAIGLGAVALARHWPNPSARLFAITGFLGGYTTFSSSMFESFELWERGDRALAVGNLLGSLAAGMLAVALGVALGRSLFEPTDRAGRPILGHEAKIERRLETISDALSGHESPEDHPG